MKEDKKTVRKPNTSKKPNTANKKHTTQPKKNNNNVKKNNNNINKNKNVSEAPRVTKIESTVKEKKNVAIENDFIEEDNDKKLIVVIAIAVLVILATIIGLLVGFDNEEETPEPPIDDEIVVPVEDEEDEDEKQDVVVKVTTTKSQKEDKEEEEVIVIPTYDVIYYYGQENRKHQDSVEEGNAIDEYVPTGYSSCTYHKDANFTEEYEFDNVYEDQTVYLQCTAITYTVVYNFDANKVTDNTANATTFDVDNPVDLVAPTTTSVFVGWYLENGTQVTTLDRKLVKYADENNTINLFAELTDKVKVEFYNNENTLLDEEELTQASYTLPDVANMNVCPTSGKFLGWSTKENNKNVVYNNKAELQLTEDIKLYAVCGDATIVYVSNEETVTVGYTNAEINDLGIELPEPSQLGMETPTYFVPVDTATSTSKKVVSDDEVELGENEVYFSQVVDNAIDGYTPTVGDNVEGFDKVFLGWIEKTEETPSEPTTQEPTTQEPTLGVETAANEEITQSEENAVTEDITILSESEETPIVEEEVVEPFKALPEEIVEELTTSTEETPSVELEAVWGIPEVEETPVEPTPEEQAPEVASLPVA